MENETEQDSVICASGERKVFNQRGGEMLDFQRVPVLMIHKRDGHVIRRFESITEAAIKTERDRNALAQSIHKKRLSSGPCFMRFESEWSGREDFGIRTNNRPVIVATAERIQWFDGITSATQALRVSHDAIRNLLCKGGESRRGFRVRYALSTDDWALLRADVAKLSSEDLAPVKLLAFGKPARLCGHGNANE